MRTAMSSLAAIATTLAIAGCTEFTNGRNLARSGTLDAAFATVPVGYTMAQTSYDASAEGSGPMFPGGPMHGLGRGPGPGMGGGFGGMIGGGLGGDFLGGRGLGPDFGHGPRGDPDANSTSCAFNAASGRAECAPVTERGLTVTRSIAWSDASGAVQSAFDSVTTNTINTRVTVTGTVTRRDSATSTINASSNRTVGGLAKGSTAHTVNGTAAGSEVTTGKDTAGTFTASRVSADTIAGVRIPVSDTGRTYPTAGTITRVMSVTVTRSSGVTTSSRREVITYDGTATAKMVITQDGTTRTCTLPLPFGRPTCS